MLALIQRSEKNRMRWMLLGRQFASFCPQLINERQRLGLGALLSFVFCLILSSSMACRSVTGKDAQPLPIGQWLEAKGGYVLLTAPWDFYWDVLLRPTDELPQEVSQLPMGRIWNGFVQNTGFVTPSKGNATYRYVLRDLAPRPGGYSLAFKYALSSYRAYIFPQQRPMEAIEVNSGRVSLTRDGAAPSRKWNVATFGSDKQEDWVILVLVSNHFHELGGFREAPILSLADSYQKDYEVQQLGTFVCIGAMASIAFYSFTVYLRRRSDRAGLMLACVAGMVVVRVIGINPLLYKYLPDTAALFNFQVKLDLITACPPVACYIMFLYYSFPIKLSRWIRQASLFFNLFYVGFILVVPVAVSTVYRPVMLAAILLHSLLGAYLLLTSTYRRVDGVSYIFIGTLVAFFALIHDTLGPVGLVSSPPIIQFGLTLFLIIQSQLVARRSAQAFADTETLAIHLKEKNAEISAFNANLQDVIDFKTREIRTILDHIPQGVLLIGDDCKVEGDYSANLAELIGTSKIAHESVMDLIFESSDLNSDNKDRLLQSIRATIGGRRLSFDVNIDNFPTEFSIKVGNQLRDIKATWNILLNEGQKVEFILLTLLDVTSELASARQHEVQQRDFAVVQQLLSIEPKDAARFFHSASLLLEESRSLLNAPGHCTDPSLLRNLFMNAHTVKGSARTLQLNDLANAIHKVEDRLQAFLEQKNPVDLPLLLHDIEESIRIFDVYRSINFRTLNRAHDTVPVQLGKQFIADQMNFLTWLSSEDFKPSEALQSALKSQILQLTRLAQEHLPALFDGYKEGVLKMARELGRDPPHLDFKLVDISISKAVAITLDRCLVHILSNALDHGIETVEERLHLGKARYGTIRISSTLDGDVLVLSVSDDGRGLLIERLHALGMDSGILTLHSQREDIANSVFAMSVSTSPSVSLHSGRGLGLGAVRSFLHSVGGDVTIHLEEVAADTPREGVPFYLKIRIPLVDIRS